MRLRLNVKLQRKLVNVITVGQRWTDYIIQMITLSKSTSYILNSLILKIGTCSIRSHQPNYNIISDNIKRFLLYRWFNNTLDFLLLSPCSQTNFPQQQLYIGNWLKCDKVLNTFLSKTNIMTSIVNVKNLLFVFFLSNTVHSTFKANFKRTVFKQNIIFIIKHFISNW